MRHNREELLQQMDMALANQKDKIDTIQDSKLKKDLEKISQAVEDLHFQIQMDDGLTIHNANKRMNGFFLSLVGIFRGKYIKSFILAFMAGLIVALVPTLLYISYLRNDNMLKFHFVPNAIAYKKPEYVRQIITEEELQKVQQSTVRNAKIATIGAVIELGQVGLTVIPAIEFQSPTHHLKYVNDQHNMQKEINGFVFTPNTIFSKDPISIETIDREIIIELVKNDKSIGDRDLLSIGAAVSCPVTGCYVIAKSTLNRAYEKVIPISDL